MLFAELLGEVDIVVVVVGSAGQLQDAISYLLRYPVDRPTTAIAVSQACCALLSIRGHESSDLPYGQPEHLCGFAGFHPSSVQFRDHLESLLFFHCQCHSLSHG
jgi:hypothetical protein